MFRRHPTRELAAYHHHQLSPEREKWIAGHLAGCGACRLELDEIAFAARLAEKLPLATAPESLYRSIEEALPVAEPIRSSRVRLRLWPQAALSLGVFVLVGLAWYFGFRQPLRAAIATSPPSALEAVAVAEHAKRIQGALDWQLQTSESRRLQQWLTERSGLFAHLPDKRPDEDAGYFRLLGVSLLTAGGPTTAIIGYEVDRQPVTLLTAKLSQVRDAPQEARFSKDVFYRAEAEHGFHVLSWATEGQAYVMVSSLPQYGHQGCFLCHTTSARRELISRMNPR